MSKTKPTSATQDPLKSGANLRVSTLAPRLGMSKSTIWRLVREGKFPKPIKLSDKVTVWKADSIIEWLASKEAA
ncbi:AlpA family phage regulatory protein [Methylovulum psychrotolerans]|uniref:helix-turn-helix transcriptional regulator n=1 Tax=Methylovulum psychrotolerans TaxID=1704499 RepID=UPI001BFF45BB|nr:AlpA family phage regulatory protein [Methylovulum psychrotolerans]MBT9098771.1 AlpA family phage regulatory protein [Methylovulum psychrotolerans]